MSVTDQIINKLQQIEAILPMCSADVRGRVFCEGQRSFVVSFDKPVLGGTDGCKQIYELLVRSGLVDNPSVKRDDRGYIDILAPVRGEGPLKTGDNTHMRYTTPGKKGGYYQFVIDLAGKKDSEVLTKLEQAVELAIEQRKEIEGKGDIAPMPHLHDPAGDWKKHIVSLPDGVDAAAALKAYAHQKTGASQGKTGWGKLLSAMKNAPTKGASNDIGSREVKIEWPKGHDGATINRLYHEWQGMGGKIRWEGVKPSDGIVVYDSPMSLLEMIRMHDPQGVDKAIASCAQQKLAASVQYL